ncbi:hypothetical protein [Bradyrhizobium sp. WSM2793]|uniref:hypothetical protein n=1 Tax=Bradyrhizobium sp. WSM2793 TaxID=1038866 RepID=UPI0012FB0AC6|nr:hypothetical protein [Bradyrhizobium sp. WSM2793]
MRRGDLNLRFLHYQTGDGAAWRFGVIATIDRNAWVRRREDKQAVMFVLDVIRLDLTGGR